MCFIRFRPEHAPLNPPGAAPTLMTIEQEHQYFAAPSQPSLDHSPSPRTTSIFKPGAPNFAQPSTTGVSASSSSPSNSLSKPSGLSATSSSPADSLSKPFGASHSPLLSDPPPLPAGTTRAPVKKSRNVFRRGKIKGGAGVERMPTEDGARKGSTKSQQKVQKGINASLGMGALVVGQDKLGESVRGSVGEEGMLSLGVGAKEDRVGSGGGRKAPTLLGLEEEGVGEEVVEMGGVSGRRVERGGIGLAL